MSDPMHMSLTAFRETMLTAIARLEFELRDAPSLSLRNATWLNTTASLPTRRPPPTWGEDDLSQEESESSSQALSAMITSVETMLKGFESRLAALEARSSSEPSVVAELLTMEPRSDSKNVVVHSRTTTPALAAAVAAANPPGMSLDAHEEESDEEEDEQEIEEEADAEEEAEEEVEVEVEEEAVEEEAAEEVEVEEEAAEEEDEEPDLRPIVVKGVQYYIDAENTAYVETEDSYEAIGKYDPQSRTVTLDSDEQEEQEIEVEEFEYKGQTYQRDPEGNVYQGTEEVIGRWTGTKIVFKKA